MDEMSDSELVCGIEDDIMNFDISSGEDEEDDEMDNKMWRVLGHDSCVKNCSVFKSFKYYVRLCRMLDHDKTYKEVMKTVQKARDEDDMGFKEALDYAVHKRRNLIFRIIDKTKKDTA